LQSRFSGRHVIATQSRSLQSITLAPQTMLIAT
jgi:hypothetical protein